MDDRNFRLKKCSNKHFGIIFSVEISLSCLSVVAWSGPLSCPGKWSVLFRWILWKGIFAWRPPASQLSTGSPITRRTAMRCTSWTCVSRGVEICADGDCQRSSLMVKVSDFPLSNIRTNRRQLGNIETVLPFRHHPFCFTLNDLLSQNFVEMTFHIISFICFSRTWKSLWKLEEKRTHVCLTLHANSNVPDTYDFISRCVCLYGHRSATRSWFGRI